ncbi:MAG: NAD(P)/FAD-dependent oxidoreductase [Candidatus Hydrogenedentota bacterium]
MTATATANRSIAIVGTGFSGLCLAIHLKKTGNDSFVLFERASDIGGTWRENTYPGAECDIPSALYSFSFERNPRWSHKWSEQREILQYVKYCAEKYDLYPHIRFNKEVLDARFDEDTGKWRVETDDGSVEHFDAFVCAVGQLHRTHTPAIEGAETFRGAKFHSAEWDHSVALDGKKVACIGNGASAVQFLPQIAPKVERLTIFQRTANWIVPKNDRPYTELEKRIGTIFPAFTNLQRFRIWFRGDVLLYPLMHTNTPKWLRNKSHQDAINYINEKIRDPERRKVLVPDYPMGAKRILFSDDIYDAYDRDNVNIVTAPIRRIVPNGVETSDGKVHEAEVLIYGTGFRTTSFLTPMRVQGRSGRVLNEVWEEKGAEAYLGITHTGFPNFFMMYGPNTNLGHNSIIVMIECQTRYILSCLNALNDRSAKWLDVRENVQSAYNDWLQNRMKKMVWITVERSWYRTKDKVTNNWVGRTTEYRRRTRSVNPADYEFA